MVLLKQHCCKNAETPASKCILAAFFQCSILVACLHIDTNKPVHLKMHMAKMAPINKLVLLKPKSDVFKSCKNAETPATKCILVAEVFSSAEF